MCPGEEPRPGRDRRAPPLLIASEPRSPLRASPSLAAFLAFPPLFSETRLPCAASSAAPRGRAWQVPTARRATVTPCPPRSPHSCSSPSRSLAAPLPFLPEESGDKGSPCFILILHTLPIFCLFPSLFFFLPTFFFSSFFLLLQLPKASQGPPPPLQPPEHLPQSSPLQLGAPFPIQFLTSCSRVPLLSRRPLSHLKQVSLLCSELSSHLAKTTD